MFSFCKPSKTKILNCYTHYTNGIHNLFPPAKPKNPEWFSKLPVYSDIEMARFAYASTGRAGGNLRHCPGRSNLYQKGFMLKMWSDLYLKIGPEGTDEYAYQFADRTSSVSPHPPYQYKGLVSEYSYCQLKINSPWFFYSDEPLEVLGIKPAWEVHGLNGLEILPGILDFHIMEQSHINMFIKREKTEKEIIIKAGTPIYHFIPLNGVNVKLNVECRTIDSITTRIPSKVYFNNSYNKVKKIINDSILRK